MICVNAPASELDWYHNDKRSYLQHFDDIWDLQLLLLCEASKFGTPVVECSDRAATVQEATRFIIKAITPEHSLDVHAVFGPPEQ